MMIFPSLYYEKTNTELREYTSEDVRVDHPLYFGNYSRDYKRGLG